MCILKIIINAVNNDGTLERDFCLWDKLKNKDNEEFHFADGARDGILLYHTRPTENTDISILKNVIDSASNGSMAMAGELLSEYVRENSVVIVMDDIQKYIIDNKESLNAAYIYEFASECIKTGENPETVKFGLTVIELFNIDDSMKDIVRTLALCDEFTLFSLYIMMTFENAEQEMLDAAKKVRGWGRIHAVHLMTANDEKTRLWLLKSGADNDILANYSALDCYNKVNIHQALQKRLSKALYDGLSLIIKGLVDDSPLYGISAVKESEDLLYDFLEQTEKRSDIDDYGVIKDIYEYAKEKSIGYIWNKAKKILYRKG